MTLDKTMKWPRSCVAAAAILMELASHGVRDVVYCPGSRSAPFAYVLEALAESLGLRTHIRLDERSAGFLALGLVRGTQKAASLKSMTPVAVVTTSGTAVAELHSAVAEARHSHVPLIVLSADRPQELRFVGASQTTQQMGIFASHVLGNWDLDADNDGVTQIRNRTKEAVNVACGVAGVDAGPVQLNIGLREPLQPEMSGQFSSQLPKQQELMAAASAVGRQDTDAHEEAMSVVASPSTQPQAEPWEKHIRPDLNTIIIAADGADPHCVNWAQSAGIPLLAEPTVGWQWAEEIQQGVLLRHQQSLLADSDLSDAVQQVVLTGRPTLSRVVNAILARRDIRVIVQSPWSTWTDLTGNADVVVTSLLPAIRPHDNTQWLSLWQQAIREHNERIATVLSGSSAIDAARHVWNSSSRSGALIVGASNAIRALDLGATGPSPRLVVANRGLAGIDGTIATAVGVALQQSQPSVALMGDLTFFHDAGALAIPRDEVEPDLTIVVLDDGGGAIFANLEHGRSPAKVYDRWFRTAQRTSIEGLCAAYSVPFRNVDVADLPDILNEAVATSHGLRVVRVEVPCDPELYSRIRG